MPKLEDLTIYPEDSKLVRTLKELLTYGGHKEGCDLANQGGPPDEQHICCSCGWCTVADGAGMDLLFDPSNPLMKGTEQ